MRDKRLEILASNIKAERVRKKLSQLDLALRIEINPNSMSKIEQAKQTPSAFIVFDIANTLGISVDELFKDVSKSKS